MRMFYTLSIDTKCEIGSHFLKDGGKNGNIDFCIDGGSKVSKTVWLCKSANKADETLADDT